VNLVSPVTNAETLSHGLLHGQTPVPPSDTFVSVISSRALGHVRSVIHATSRVDLDAMIDSLLSSSSFTSCLLLTSCLHLKHYIHHYRPPRLI
jgi:hypothetical protein